MAEEVHIWIESFNSHDGRKKYSVKGQYQYDEIEEPDEWYDLCPNCGTTKSEINPDVDQVTKFCGREGCFEVTSRVSEVFEIATSSSKVELQKMMKASTTQMLKELLKDPTIHSQSK